MAEVGEVLHNNTTEMNSRYTQAKSFQSKIIIEKCGTCKNSPTQLKFILIILSAFPQLSTVKSAMKSQIKSFLIFTDSLAITN